uniref:Peptidase_S9 domain-containing protein n=1 Tax=Meloidogyne hapla TaxID=6305 RepID=A0A1I8BBW7_MELHA
MLKNMERNFRLKLVKSPQQKYKYKIEWFEGMPVDHFSYIDSRKFNLRYLINIDNFKQKNAPILFFLGEEQDIENCAELGFIWEIAPEFGAAVIFAEHRYFGESLPFGNDTFKNVSTLGYLSTEQALADFAQLIAYLKEERLNNAENSLVIGFGASYSGQLAAWMRVKVKKNEYFSVKKYFFNI